MRSAPPKDQMRRQQIYEFHPTLRSLGELRATGSKPDAATLRKMSPFAAEAATIPDVGVEEACAVCGSGGRLLLCARCPLAFHLTCVNPALVSDPDELWCCTRCVTPHSFASQWREHKSSSVLAAFKQMATHAKGGNPLVYALPAYLAQIYINESSGSDWLRCVRCGKLRRVKERLVSECLLADWNCSHPYWTIDGISCSKHEDRGTLMVREALRLRRITREVDFLELYGPDFVRLSVDCASTLPLEREKKRDLLIAKVRNEKLTRSHEDSPYTIGLDQFLAVLKVSKESLSATQSLRLNTLSRTIFPRPATVAGDSAQQGSSAHNSLTSKRGLSASRSKSLAFIKEQQEQQLGGSRTEQLQRSQSPVASCANEQTSTLPSKRGSIENIVAIDARESAMHALNITGNSLGPKPLVGQKRKVGRPKKVDSSAVTSKQTPTASSDAQGGHRASVAQSVSVPSESGRVVSSQQKRARPRPRADQGSNQNPVEQQITGGSVNRPQSPAKQSVHPQHDSRKDAKGSKEKSVAARTADPRGDPRTFEDGNASSTGDKTEVCRHTEYAKLDGKRPAVSLASSFLPRSENHGFGEWDRSNAPERRNITELPPVRYSFVTNEAPPRLEARDSYGAVNAPSSASFALIHARQPSRDLAEVVYQPMRAVPSDYQYQHMPASWHDPVPRVAFPERGTKLDARVVNDRTQHEHSPQQYAAPYAMLDVDVDGPEYKALHQLVPLGARVREASAATASASPPAPNPAPALAPALALAPAPASASAPTFAPAPASAAASASASASALALAPVPKLSPVPESLPVAAVAMTARGGGDESGGSDRSSSVPALVAMIAAFQLDVDAEAVLIELALAGNKDLLILFDSFRASPERFKCHALRFLAKQRG